MRRTLCTRCYAELFAGGSTSCVSHTCCIRTIAGVASTLILCKLAWTQLFVGSRWEKLKCKDMLWTPLQFARSSRKHRSKRADEPSTLTLDRIRAGREVRIVQIVAGQSATRQLAQLCIRVGTTLKVRRSAPMGGPVLVDSGGSMVAIGRGMARKVSVEILR
jgi:ferrous iron transport protein A